MSWKPSEMQIVDYIYGTLPAEMQKKFDEYLLDHPYLAIEIKELMQTQNLLPALSDEEVIPHIPFTTEDRNSSRLKLKSVWLYPLSIAASLILLLVTGYLTQFKLSFTDDGFYVGFQADYRPVVPVISNDQIEHLINEKIDAYSAEVSNDFNLLESGFNAQLAKNQSITKEQLNKVVQQYKTENTDESQILNFIAQLKDENRQMMMNFYKTTAEDQKTLMRNILLDFNDYLDLQRQKDLRYVEANIQEIKNSSELQQEQTEKLLADIITTVNNQYSLD